MNEQLRLCGQELEALLPDGGGEQAAAPIGGIISKVFELVAALKAGEVKTAWKLTRYLLDLFILGDEATSGGESIEFQQQVAAGLLDRAKLIALLLKILPILLGS